MGILAIILAVAAAAQVPDVPVAVQIITENGTYVLRSAEGGKPLYTFDQDEAGKSNCNDGCASAWPPLAVPANARPVGKWTIVNRADGSRQWAYEGKPVYSFARDAEGTPSGDGMGGLWHLLPATPAK